MRALRKELLSAVSSVKERKNRVYIRVKGNQNYCISTVVGSVSNDVKVLALAEIVRRWRQIESQVK